MTTESASGKIDARIRELDDWRGRTLAAVRGALTDLIRAAVNLNTSGATR